MHNITLLSSFHMQHGKCNPRELYKIIEKIQPEVIFEEMSYDLFHNIYYTNDFPPRTVEAITIKEYLKTYKIRHIPVDTLKKNYADLFDGYEIIARNSVEYNNLFKTQISLLYQYGYDFLNSNVYNELIDKILLLEKNVLLNINDAKLSNQYEVDKELHHKREIEMLQNIYDYSKIHQYNQALFICGADHRKSIIQMIPEIEAREKLKLNWTFYTAQYS